MINYNLEYFEDILDQRALLLLSGGLDSSYFLWKYQQYHNDVICHYVNLYSNRIRSKIEKQVVKNITEYFSNKNIVLYQSEFNTNFHKAVVRDFVFAAISSIEIAKDNNCKYIVIGDELLDSIDRVENNYIDRQYYELHSYLNNLVLNLSDYKIQICSSSKSLNLNKDYQEMPKDYVSLLFSCREPTHFKNNYYICGDCHACRKNIQFGWFDQMTQKFTLEE